MLDTKWLTLTLMTLEKQCTSLLLGCILLHKSPILPFLLGGFGGVAKDKILPS
jgi:hypothetical protein